MNAESQDNRRSGPLPSNRRQDWLFCLSIGFLYYYLTSMIVVIAAVLGHDLLPRSGRLLTKPDDALQSFANWDGEWYLGIVQNGYAYDSTKPSSVAFFPA